MKSYLGTNVVHQAINNLSQQTRVTVATTVNLRQRDVVGHWRQLPVSHIYGQTPVSTQTVASLSNQQALGACICFPICGRRIIRDQLSCQQRFPPSNKGVNVKCHRWKIYVVLNITNLFRGRADDHCADDIADTPHSCLNRAMP